MKRALVLAAALVVLVANTWVVVSSLRNRAAAPGGTVELTERELRLLPAVGDSTAVLLNLRWEVAATEPDDDGAPAWLNAVKLEELGFDCSVPAASPHARDHYDSVPSALLFLVLEFDGDAAKKAGHDRGSRLFVVDVGRDASQLRAKYPDTARHLITRGVVKPFLKDRTRLEGRPLPQPRLSARVHAVLPNLIFVPPPHHVLLQGLKRHPDFEGQKANPEPPPRYVVALSWGTRYEPWVRSVRLLPVAPEVK